MSVKDASCETWFVQVQMKPLYDSLAIAPSYESHMHLGGLLAKVLRSTARSSGSLFFSLAVNSKLSAGG